MSLHIRTRNSSTNELEWNPITSFKIRVKNTDTEELEWRNIIVGYIRTRNSSTNELEWNLAYSSYGVNPEIHEPAGTAATKIYVDSEIVGFRGSSVSGTYLYQWQVSSDGTSWSNSTKTNNSGTLTGSNNYTPAITLTKTADNNKYYRLKITNAGVSYYSGELKVTMRKPLYAYNPTLPSTVNVGDTITLDIPWATDSYAADYYKAIWQSNSGTFTKYSNTDGNYNKYTANSTDKDGSITVTVYAYNNYSTTYGEDSYAGPYVLGPVGEPLVVGDPTLSSYSKDASSVTLNFSRGSNADKTRIYLNYDKDFIGPVPTGYGLVYDGTGSTFTKTGLSPDVTYTFYIWSYNSAYSQYSVNSVTQSVTTDALAGLTPVINNGEKMSSSQVRFMVTNYDSSYTWDGDYYGPSGTLINSSVTESAHPTNSSYRYFTITRPSSADTVVLRVTTSRTGYTTEYAEKTYTFPNTQVTDVNPSNGADNGTGRKFVVSWTNSAEATSYKLQFALASGFNWTYATAIGSATSISNPFTSNNYYTYDTQYKFYIFGIDSNADEIPGTRSALTYWTPTATPTCTVSTSNGTWEYTDSNGNATSWSTCSGGTQTRDKRRYNTTTNSDCTTTSAWEYSSDSQNCTCTEGCGDYGSWTYGSYGACASCSKSRTKSRSRTCVNTDCSTYTDTEEGTDDAACSCTASTGSWSAWSSYSSYGSCYAIGCLGLKDRTRSRSRTNIDACCDSTTETETETDSAFCNVTRWTCNNYDVTNSGSANYFYCYTVGSCDARSDNACSRTACRFS
jgi:hypothetical protein